MRKKIFLLFFLFILTFPASRYLIVSGFFEPHDLHHIADIYEMARALESGQIPPRLGPDFSFGYGYPLFNFYYLLPFYIGALFFFISGSLTVSFKLVFLLGVILSVWGMYLFLKEFVGTFSSLVGSFLFLYTPYRAVQIYVRGAIGEALSLAILPYVCWVLVILLRQPKNKKIIATASLTTAFFILSHNFLWALSMPYIALLIFALVNKKVLKQTFKSLIQVAMLSLGMTFFWWLPALLEQKLVSSATPFPLIDHFPSIKQLIVPSWGYGASLPGPKDDLSFQVGVVNLVVFVINFLLLFLRKKTLDKKILRLGIWAIVGFLVSFIMMNIRTYPIWRILPFHDFIQFPWRLLIFTTFFTAISAGILVEMVQSKKVVLGVLIIFLSLAYTFNYFKPSQVFNKTDDEYLSRMFANRSLKGEKKEVSNKYLSWSEDYLLLPKWTFQRPSSLPSSKIEISDGVVEKVREISGVHWLAKINAEKQTKLTFNSYFFPGWFAKLDGNFLKITPGIPFGQIEATIPPGIHIVEFFWRETNLRIFADLIGLVSGIIVLSFLFKIKHF